MPVPGVPGRPRLARRPVARARRRAAGAPSVHGERGQASVEHAAVVVLVLVVLTGAVAVATGLNGAGVVNAVHSGIRRAICVAGGDDCADFHVQRPCTRSVDEDVSSKGVSLGIWRVGKDRALTVERRSDGTVVVTAYDDVEGGVGTSAGLRFGIGRSSAGDEDDLEATAGVEGRLRGGWGRSWELEDEPAARDFLRRWSAGDPVRAPDVDRVRLGATTGLSGALSGPLGVDAEGDLLRGLSGEGTRDRRTGRTTLGLAVPRSVAGDLAGPLGLKLGGDLALEPSLTLVTDARLRPLELRLVGTLTDRDGSRRRDVQVRVDLTRPEVGQGLRGVVQGLGFRDVARTRAAAVALGRWAADEGWVDQREYRVASEGSGPDVELGLGVRLGFRNRDTHRSERLLRARTKPPGGIWEDRTDCVGA